MGIQRRKTEKGGVGLRLFIRPIERGLPSKSHCGRPSDLGDSRGVWVRIFRAEEQRMKMGTEERAAGGDVGSDTEREEPGRALRGTWVRPRRPSVECTMALLAQGKCVGNEHLLEKPGQET
ncbi:hypothetical protein H920_19670 [Fukomys damarensis]|uniref:Uncharacterized protein n=1 Tax=Fukomys damarensis TaxID=885580 RepID=A0A091D7W2_FUKDA|nr:hypothetical protein H920_19670 [Fukomys damarensis]